MWRKQTSPIDRCLEQLDREITRVQNQARKATVRATHGPPFKAAGLTPPTVEWSQPAEAFTGFVEEMLAPTKDKLTPSYHTIPEIIESHAEPLKELEAEPIAFVSKSGPDLFTHGQKMSLTQTGRLGSGQTSKPQTHSPSSAPKADEKLVQYLGTAGIKSYRPLKHVQRTARNRFYMWVGLSFVALWLIYFVVR